MTGIESKFACVVCGNEVKNGKPAPDIFLKAAERLGCDPSECIVMEDSDNGIRAAHAGGMRPILIPDQKQPPDEIRALAHRVFGSLHDVVIYLKTVL
jgi:beta-phosphoglucomutase-like phosphatase (HAD superfamily)